jgi:hypothetical protein
VIPGIGPVGMRKDINEYYRALGLNPGADPAQIRRAYRQLVQQWHPDLFKQGTPMQTTAEDITKEINEAYEQLYRKGLYKKFRGAAGKGSEAAPSTGKATSDSPPREDGAKETRPRARKKPPQDGPPPAPKPPVRPRQKRSWSIPRNGRIFSRVFWAKAGLGAALVLVSLEVGRMIWRSDSEPPTAAAVRRQTDAAAVPASSTVSSRPEIPSADPKGAAVAPTWTPVPAAQIDVATIPRASREALPVGFDPVENPRMKTFAARDPARFFSRAEALLDVFEVGDTKAKVRAIQGTPDNAAEDVFRYGSSLVYFKDGRVSNWSDGLPRLRVRAWPEFDGSLLDTFSLGSTRSDVVRAQGQPTAFTPQGYFYGSSAVFFGNDEVTGWSEGDVALKKLSMPVLPFFDLDSLNFR